MAASSSSALEEFICSICLEYLKNPYSLLPCNHVYCKACLDQLRNSSITHCPQCRTQSTGFCPNDMMAHRMRSKEIQCTICCSQIKASELNNHMAVCSDRPEDFEDKSNDRDEITSMSRFICPFCGKGDIKALELRQHCLQYHSKDKRKVVCPICASLPWGNPNFKSSHLISHLKLRHQFDYGGFSELWVYDEDAALEQAVIESIEFLTEEDDLNQAITIRESLTTQPRAGEDVTPSWNSNQQQTEENDDLNQAIIESLNYQTQNVTHRTDCSVIEPSLNEYDEDEAVRVVGWEHHP